MTSVVKLDRIGLEGESGSGVGSLGQGQPSALAPGLEKLW